MSSELEDFKKELMLEAKIQLELITKDIETTLKEKVESNNRQAYNPQEYIRTQQLINNIASETNGRESIIYWKDLDYENNYGEDVSNNVINWINDGYGSAPFDYYSSRPKQRFIEDTVEEINKKYGANTCERVDY